MIYIEFLSVNIMLIRKLPFLNLVMVLIAVGCIAPTSAHPEILDDPPEINLEISPTEATTKTFAVNNSQAELAPKNGDSCFPILYGEKERISLDFQSANIKNLFRIISSFSGFNLILSPEVEGFVNIRVFDLPWNEALEIILANSSLGRECFGNNAVRIASLKKLEDEAALKAANLSDSNKKIPSQDSCFPTLYGSKETISLDFQNVQIKNLFRMISEVSGFNLILSPEIDGNVNIRMLDVPWNKALEIILANNGLGRECYVDGVVRIARIEGLNKAPEILKARRKTSPKKNSKDRFIGNELSEVPPIALPVYKKIQNEHPELLKKINHFENLFNNEEKLQEMTESDYDNAVKDYKDVLKRASEINVLKTPLQDEYQAIQLKGIISLKKENVALFETLEKTGFSARKGDLIGPSYGYIDDIQTERVIVVEKSRNYLGITLTKTRSIGFSKEVSAN